MNRRQANLYTLTMLAVVGLGVLCLWNGYRRIGRPFPGFLLAANRVVVSVGRSAWLGDKADRILWAQVVAVDGRPVSTIEEIESAIAHDDPGTPITYRFRKQADVFSVPLEVRRFRREDFFALYFVFFCVGVCFSVAGWSATRGSTPSPLVRQPFFALCQTVAGVLFLGSDVYGPHWFTPAYLLFHCLIPAAIWHLTITFPENLLSDWSRRMSVVTLYAAACGMAWLLDWFWEEPPLFLPIMYTTYLLLANALLIYVGRLIVAWQVSENHEDHTGLRLALLGSFLSAAVPGAIFVSYPGIGKTIAPSLLVGPLMFFPVMTAIALKRLPRPRSRPLQRSVRGRLSLLFLAAAETAYVAGVGISWINNSWEQLVADVQLLQREQILLKEIRLSTVTRTAKLEEIESLVQSGTEADLLAAFRGANARGDQRQAAELLDELEGIYRVADSVLNHRLAALSPMDEILFAVLVILGTLQAAGFMLAVRNWLMRPVAQLSAATGVIATGDLTHRVEVDSSEEFHALGSAINSMAVSLGQIQARMDSEREARRGAAATARDAERSRLGRELHDGILQDLSAIKLLLESGNKSRESEFLAPAVEALIRVIVDLRRVVDDIAAPDLHQGSLVQAISEYSRMAARGYGIEPDLNLDASLPIAQWAARDVYRITQEAVGNALRHGSPSRLQVSLRRLGGRATLEIEDDGSGFSVENVALGAGLTSMRQRAAAIDARLEIVARPGVGTLIRLELPPWPNTQEARSSA